MIYNNIYNYIYYIYIIYSYIYYIYIIIYYIYIIIYYIYIIIYIIYSYKTCMTIKFILRLYPSMIMCVCVLAL